MTLIAERAVVAVVKFEVPTMKEADLAFAELRQRVEFTLPKLRYGKARVISRDVRVVIGCSCIDVANGH